ncbi:MAG: hypothetical protein HGB20_04160 [Chlorobiaceae bacterium]|nr:hypothetical protein [Chlorobiaceae bacterium]
MLLINRFIRLVEDHAESLSLKWVQDIRSNPLTAGYATISRDELHDLVYSRFRTLGQWIGKKEGRDLEIAQAFFEIGSQQADSGIRASEMVYSFMLERDLLWGYILDEGIVTEGIDLNRAIEFSNQLNYFYEKAIYFSLAGYEERRASRDENRDAAVFHKTFEGFKHWIVK